MNRWIPILFVISPVLAVAAAAGAQMGMRQTTLPRGIFQPVVGAGAAYESAGPSGPKQTIEFDVVGKDSVNGKDAYWLEWTFPDTQMGNILVKTEVVLDSGYTFVAKSIAQMAGGPPMEMPSQMSPTSNQKQPADLRTSADDLGSESVTTPAGTFSCEHWRMKDGKGDGWISDKVSPFGLVKSVDKDGSTLVLVKVISNATDKITGTPVPFNPLLLMGRGGR